MENIDPRLPGTSKQAPRSRGRSSGVGLSAPQLHRSEIEEFEAITARLENGEYGTEVVGGPSLEDRGCEEEDALYTSSASRNPLNNLTNVDLQSARYPQSLGEAISSIVLSPEEDAFFTGMFNACEKYRSDSDSKDDDDDAVPHQSFASDSLNPTGTTHTQETASFDDSYDDMYADEEGNYNGPSNWVDDADDDALPVPDALPARTPTTDLEGDSPYTSEPQDSPADVIDTRPPASEASSPHESQQASTATTRATNTQSQPCDGASAPNVTTEEQAGTDKKNSRKRCLSEAEDQPNKRAASESKVQANAVATSQQSLAPVVTTSQAPPLAAAIAANAALVETRAPSRAPRVRANQGEAPEATTRTTSSISTGEGSRATTASTAPGRTAVSSDANTRDTARVSTPNTQLPESAPPSCATNEGSGRRSAPVATTASNSTVIQIPAAPHLAQPVPVNATRRAANAVGPSTASGSAQFVSSPPVSSPDTEAPAPHADNRNQQTTAKQGATTQSTGGRGGRSKRQKNGKAKETIPGQMIFHLGNPEATSDGTEEKGYNCYTKFKSEMGDMGWAGKKIHETWRKMSDEEKGLWSTKADLQNQERRAKKQGSSSGRSTLATAPSPSPAPSAQDNQSPTTAESSAGPSLSTTPIEAAVQNGQVGVSGEYQQHPQAQGTTPVQQDAPGPSHNASNDYPAAHYPPVGGSQPYPHMHSAAPSNGYTTQAMPTAPPPDFGSPVHPLYGTPPMPQGVPGPSHPFAQDPTVGRSQGYSQMHSAASSNGYTTQAMPMAPPPGSGPPTHPLHGMPAPMPQGSYQQNGQVGTDGVQLQEQQSQIPAMPPPAPQFAPHPSDQMHPDFLWVLVPDLRPTAGGHPDHLPAANADQAYWDSLPTILMLVHANGVPCFPFRFMELPPATDDANASMGPGVPATNLNVPPIIPLPQSSLAYHQATPMNDDTVVGPGIPPPANNAWPQGPTWNPMPFHPGTQGPNGNNEINNQPPFDGHIEVFGNDGYPPQRE